MALITAIVVAGGIGATILLTPSASQSVLSTARAAPAPAPIVLPSFRVGPKELQDKLDALAEGFGEPVGIAVADVEANWLVQVAGQKPYPQQSVSKLWVALSTMDAIDRGLLTLETPVTIGLEDRSVFNQPFIHPFMEAGGGQTTVETLLRHALINSDNSANDRLIRQLGISHINAVLVQKGIHGVKLGADERHLQSIIAGLTWTPELGEPMAFERARSRLPSKVRAAALQAYLADPTDGASPIGIVQALSALKRGELLSPQSTAFLLDTLQKVRTGPMRLKGGLPSGWTCAHKTGTGQDFSGGSVGINDVGLITAPDGRSYAVAVMIPYSKSPNTERLALMRAISRAVAASWLHEASEAVHASL